jgi:hypothetical protein
MSGEIEVAKTNVEAKGQTDIEQEDQEFSQTDLTKSEIALIKQLRLPASAAMTVTAICEAAGVSTVSYYRAFKKDYFVKKVHDECLGVVQSAVLPIIQTAKRIAADGALPSSHHWAKMVLEMSGMYVPNKGMQIKSEINFIFNVPRPNQVTVAPGDTPIDAEAEEVK